MPVHLAQPAEEVWRKLLSYLGANLGPEPAEQRITWTFGCSKDTGYDFSKNTRRE